MTAVIARKPSASNEVFQDVGTVTRVEGREISIESGSTTFHARRATSCLVEPQVGDEVLFAGRQSGDLYVLAVLERPDGQPVTLSAQGDLSVKLPDGQFVVAARGVDLVSSQQLSLTSKLLELRAAEGKVFFESLAYLGKQVVAEALQVKTGIGALDSVIERLKQTVQRSYRRVEQMDQLRAGQIDYVADDNLRMRGHNTLVHAELLVKVDGDQIHLG